MHFVPLETGVYELGAGHDFVLVSQKDWSCMMIMVDCAARAGLDDTIREEDLERTRLNLAGPASEVHPFLPMSFLQIQNALAKTSHLCADWIRTGERLGQS